MIDCDLEYENGNSFIDHIIQRMNNILTVNKIIIDKINMGSYHIS